MRTDTDGTAKNIYPSWLPDGKRNSLYIVDAADGSGLTRVGDVQTFFARWSPRWKIAFITGGWPSSEIYVMRKDGWQQMKLTKWLVRSVA
jgi:hypothetical protein